MDDVSASLHRDLTWVPAVAVQVLKRLARPGGCSRSPGRKRQQSRTAGGSEKAAVSPERSIRTF